MTEISWARRTIIITLMVAWCINNSFGVSECLQYLATKLRAVIELYYYLFPRRC